MNSPKPYLIFLFLLSLHLPAYSQEDFYLDDVPVEVEQAPEERIVPATYLTEWPRFKKCKDETGTDLRDCFNATIQKHAEKKLRYPQNYRVNDPQSIMVTTSFTIDTLDEGPIPKGKV